MEKRGVSHPKENLIKNVRLCQEKRVVDRLRPQWLLIEKEKVVLEEVF